jgi:uncharacterized DUF497 family protein
VNFEWNEDKNRKNIRKHGLDFHDAWEIFAGPLCPELDLRSNYGEDRWTVIGLLRNRVVVVTFTFGSKDVIRIISCGRH